jgi:flagellar motor switch protein FliN/FliY
MTEVLTRVADFLQLSPGGKSGGSLPLDFLLDVSVPISAELGHTSLPIGDVLNLEPGSVVQLDRDISQPIDLVVCGVLFARGEVVVVEDRFAVRIKELLHTRGKKGAK